VLPTTGKTLYAKALKVTCPAGAGYKAYVYWRATVGTGTWTATARSAAFTVTPWLSRPRDDSDAFTLGRSRSEMRRGRCRGCVRPRWAMRWSFACRRDADKTPHRGLSRLSTAWHGAHAEPWTVQHLCARLTMARHACRVFPRPGVGCSIQPGGTTSCLHMAISVSAFRPNLFRIGKIADTCSSPSVRRPS